MKKLSDSFFNKDTIETAKGLLGKVIFRKYKNIWLKVQIIETEAYLLEEKGSHASLGFTEKRKALFMKPGTIYMYYARGKDSLNISTKGEGNAVLIKSGIPFIENAKDLEMVETMRSFLPHKANTDLNFLCSGQTLLAKALDLKVPEWDKKSFTKEFFIADVGYAPEKIITAIRLGIPIGRDEHLLYRFIDESRMKFCTKRPSRSVLDGK